MNFFPPKQSTNAKEGLVLFRMMLNLHNVLDLCTGITFQLKETRSLEVAN